MTDKSQGVAEARAILDMLSHRLRACIPDPEAAHQ
jgi:hypothetical protein